MLITNHADPNGQSQDDDTPLSLAARSGSLKFVEKFIEKCRKHMSSIDWSIRNKYGRTPLHMAALCIVADRVEIARKCLSDDEGKARVKINEHDVSGDTALHLALKNVDAAAYAEFVRVLLWHGADPDAQNFRREAGIHIAAAACSRVTGVQQARKVLKLLMRADCLLDIQTDEAKTAYIIAHEWNHKDCMFYLSDCGADVFIPNGDQPAEAQQAQVSAHDSPPHVGGNLPLNFDNACHMSAPENEDFLIDIKRPRCVHCRPAPQSPNTTLSVATEGGQQQQRCCRSASVENAGNSGEEGTAKTEAAPLVPTPWYEKMGTYLLFALYVVWCGFLRYPYSITYEYIVGTKLTKVLNGGVINYDNSGSPDPPPTWRKRLAEVFGWLTIVFMAITPFVCTYAAEKGYGGNAVAAYVLFIFTFQVMTIVKAAHDRVFFRVNHPEYKVRIILPKQDEDKEKQKGKQKEKRDKLLFCIPKPPTPKWTKRIKWANLPPLLTILTDCYGYSAFAFFANQSPTAEVAPVAPVEPTTSSKPIFVLQNAFKAFLFDFGFDTYTFSLAIVYALVIFWLGVHAFIVTAQYVLHNKKLQERFKFINAHSLDGPGLDILVGLLSGSCFGFVTQVFFKALDCNGDGILDATPMVCWTARHSKIAGTAMLALQFYLMTTFMQSLYFREPRVRGDRDIQVIGFFGLVENILKTIISMAGVLLNDKPSYIFRINCITLLILLTMTITLKPCRHIRAINYARVAAYGCALWSVSISFLFLFFPSQVGSVDAFVGWIIICVGTYIVFRGNPRRDLAIFKIMEKTEKETEELTGVRISNGTTPTKAQAAFRRICQPCTRPQDEDDRTARGSVTAMPPQNPKPPVSPGPPQGQQPAAQESGMGATGNGSWALRRGVSLNTEMGVANQPVTGPVVDLAAEDLITTQPRGNPLQPTVQVLAPVPVPGQVADYGITL